MTKAAPEEPASRPSDPGGTSRTGMAAERTWLAWWRTALAASAGALAVGRLAPQFLNAARGPYVILGCGYGLLAVALLVVGAHRHIGLQHAVDREEQAPLHFMIVIAFTVGGILLALTTVVLVIAGT